MSDALSAMPCDGRIVIGSDDPGGTLIAGRRIGVVGVLSLRSIVTGSEASPCLCPVLSYA